MRSQFADDEGEVGIAVDPKAFFAVVLDGRLVGSFSIMVYSDEFAFGGFYILDPEYRGQGIGLAILEHIDRLAESYNFGISAARSPVRPNPIALSPVPVLGIDTPAGIAGSVYRRRRRDAGPGHQALSPGDRANPGREGACLVSPLTAVI